MKPAAKESMSFFTSENVLLLAWKLDNLQEKRKKEMRTDRSRKLWNRKTFFDSSNDFTKSNEHQTKQFV